MNKQDFLQIARDYVNNKHYSVIPVAKNKIPLVNWKPYQERFATDEELVQWSELSEVQLGIVTGKLSNLTVVDVEKGGDASIFPQTGTIVETGGGGAHFYFLYEPRLRNKARAMDLVDVRSEGGYVVAPGSESSKGFYKIAQEASLGPLPVSFIEKAEKVSTLAGFDAISAMLDADQNPRGNDFGYSGYETGNRNEEMTRFIGSVLTKVHPANWNTEAWQIIVLANLKNRPPLPERELRASFESIKQTEIRNNPLRWNKPAVIEEEKSDILQEEDKVVLAEEKRKELEEKRKNVPRFIAECGIPSLDACLEGFRKGQLIVLSGPPKSGKTSVCQTFTKKFVKDGISCLWFSYEIPYEDLFEKFPFENLDFYVPNYLKSGNVEWIEEKIVESIKNHGTKIVFIDHLDFLRDPKVLKGINLNLSSYLGGIVQKVKSMAYRHNIIIFLMCHIRKNKWTSKYLPASEEIRDSGQITQLADIVLMIMRKRSKNAHEIYEGNKAYLGVMENRHNGRTVQILLDFVDKEFIQDSCVLLENEPDLEEIAPGDNWNNKQEKLL